MSINCRAVEKWIWQEGVGNLPTGVLEHASGCPECRGLIEQIRLMDRSVAGSLLPDPDDAYWDAMRERVSRRLDNPTSTVIELVPSLPAWRRLVVRAWAPTLAVALVALIASQRTTMQTAVPVVSERERSERDAALPSPSLTGRNDSRVDANWPAPTEGVSTESARSAQGDRQPEAAPPVFALQPQVKTSNAVPSWTSPTSPEKSTMTPSQSSDGRDARAGGELDKVWPDRQVAVMGKVDSGIPSRPLEDDKRLAAQDPFGAYERQNGAGKPGMESAGTFATPGRLLEGPATTGSRGAERLTPVEQMRRFDEISELRSLIAHLEQVPPSSRAMSQWNQWSTAWFRLGMLTDQPLIIDSALTAVDYFMGAVPSDESTAAEWQSRRLQLENRHALLRR